MFTCWICKKGIDENDRSVILEYSPITPIVAHRVCGEDKFLQSCQYGTDEAMEFWEKYLPDNFLEIINDERKLNRCPICRKSVSSKQNFAMVWIGKRKLAVHKGCLKDKGLLKWIE